MRTKRAVWILAPLGAGLALMATMPRAGRPPAERALMTRRGPETPPPPLAADFSPPQAHEVASAVERVFRGAVLLDDRETVVAGDFNGDGSPDLAAPVRVQPERLAEVIDPLANWTLESLGPPGPAATVRADSALIAVIHGQGPRGWRDTEARQCVLLAVSEPGPIGVQPREDVRSALGRRGSREASGDVLTLAGRGERPLGIAFWTGARYAWHPPVAQHRGAAVGR